MLAEQDWTAVLQATVYGIPNETLCNWLSLLEGSLKKHIGLRKMNVTFMVSPHPLLVPRSKNRVELYHYSPWRAFVAYEKGESYLHLWFYVHGQAAIIFTLPSHCTVLHYMLDAQAFLQPQRVPYRKSDCDSLTRTKDTIYRNRMFGSLQQHADKISTIIDTDNSWRTDRQTWSQHLELFFVLQRTPRSL
jgi:hypothetical protein